MEVEYWQTSFDGKINDSDVFLTDLSIKYCQQNNNALNVKKAVSFSNKVYNVITLIRQFRAVLFKAECDVNNLARENKALKAKLSEFENDNNAIQNESIKSVQSDVIEELKKEYDQKMLEFKDKYQIQIVELEQENDRMLKELIKLSKK